MPVFNKLAIDYEAGLDVVDSETGQVITDPDNYSHKRRLVLKPRKIGCMVMTVDECKEALRKRGFDV